MLNALLSNLGQRGGPYAYDALPYFRGNLTPSTMLNYTCKLVYIYLSKQPSTISKHHNPLKIRGSLALKYQQGKHLLSFVWSCTSTIKSEPCCIKELNTFQILAWLKHRSKATRTTIDNIYSYIMRPLTSRISRGQHHSTCHDDRRYPCHHIIRSSSLLFPRAATHKRVYILTLWDKVAPSVV